MTDLAPLDLPDLARRWKLRSVAVFGSVACGEDGPDSDLDLLLAFEPDAAWSLFDIVTLKDELEAVLGRPVDVAERGAVEKSPNWIRRDAILSSARTLYEAD